MPPLESFDNHPILAAGILVAFLSCLIALIELLEARSRKKY